MEYNDCQGSAVLGGIAGQMKNSSIVRCVNTGDISYNKTNWEVAGIVGKIEKSGSSIVTDCYNLGSGGYGGITGYVENTAVSNCYSLADSWGQCAGFADTDFSSRSGATFTNCYAYDPAGESSTEKFVTVLASKEDFTTLAAALNGDRTGEDAVWVQGAEYPELKVFYNGEVVEPVVTTATISAVDGATVTYAVTLADEDADAVVLVALYSGNDLVAVKTANAAETSVTLDTAEGANMAKIFVWESLTTAKPIVVAGEYSIAQ